MKLLQIIITFINYKNKLIKKLFKNLNKLCIKGKIKVKFKYHR